MIDPGLQSRRRMLQTSAAGFGHVALTAMLGQQALSAELSHITARAKRIVFLFMKGGPSHVDTFDPKPLLTRDHGKPLPFDLPRVTFAKQTTLLKSPWKFKRCSRTLLSTLMTCACCVLYTARILLTAARC
jgi:hypothetical protein